MSQELFFVLTYLTGAFPTSFVIGKLFFSINLLEHGSKNLGATNAFRVLGKAAGLWVLALDILKGFIPVLIATKLWPDSLTLSATAGIIAVVGHSFSIFVKFKGGKGVATSTGVFLALAPKALLLSLLSFSIVVAGTSYISLGSIVGAVCLPLAVYLFEDGWKILLPVASGLSGFIIFKHRSNMVRLWRGEESRFQWKKSKTF
ncbi:MAG: glycerol-3-phosphate 1-O-acyltransferase PlsY [Candidatus Cloacimonetes bacterium]|nr:glycerol-3-phosphate 1-O-acyltransferase PlsY [Candidatus Cloacimonadota bacterium]